MHLFLEEKIIDVGQATQYFSLTFATVAGRTTDTKMLHRRKSSQNGLDPASNRSKSAREAPGKFSFHTTGALTARPTTSHPETHREDSRRTPPTSFRNSLRT
jgi:hypothetical protein